MPQCFTRFFVNVEFAAQAKDDERRIFSLDPLKPKPSFGILPGREAHELLTWLKPEPNKQGSDFAGKEKWPLKISGEIFPSGR